MHRVPLRNVRPQGYRRGSGRGKVHSPSRSAYSLPGCPRRGGSAKGRWREPRHATLEVALLSLYRLFLPYTLHPRLRTGIAAGAPVPIELMKSLMTELNLVDLTNAYGMSALVRTLPVPFILICFQIEAETR